MLEDGIIKAGLVYDESKLNRERISVTWVSPNYWGPGFIYGNVGFVFNWRDLIANRRYYWVESMQQYNPTAARILVTDNDHTGRLTQYDPQKGDGPWWHDVSSDTHWWNGKFTLEVMLERDLTLVESTRTMVVDHHSKFCNIEGSSCTDLGLSASRAHVQFLSAVSYSGIATETLNWSDNGEAVGELPHASLSVWFELRSRAKSVVYQGTQSMTDNSKVALGRAILGALARDDSDEIITLASYFGNEAEMLNSCGMVVDTAFNIQK